MGGGQSPICLPGTAGTVQASEEANGDPLSSDRLVDSPILLLVFFHKAFREELALLHHLAEGSHPGSIAELQDRFKFLKLAYKYHCAAEDEVIFQALDSHVDNIACTYSLEHKSIDDRFDSLFWLVEASLKKGKLEESPNSSLFQEIMFSVGAIQASICKHMQKEEEQVFPKLMKKLPREEQISLIWQFLCSVPIVLLEDMLPWVITFLSPKEWDHVISCIKEAVPKEEALQELVTSWLRKKNRASSANGSSNVEMTQSLLSCFPVWHAAIQKDFEATLEELHQLRRSMSFSSLDLVIVHLKFLADVLTFYSNALDQLFYPVFTEISGGLQLPALDQFTHRSQIQSLRSLLHCKEKLDGPDSRVVDRLCKELESWRAGIARFLAFHEEVFDLIIKNCSHEAQRHLLISSIRTLPLGLLKCLITWFSTHLTDMESASILHITKREDYLEDKPFTSLLHEWFRVAFTGKTSLDKFRRDLQGIFWGKNYIVYEQMKEANLRRLPNKEVSSCSYLGIEKPNMAYSSRTNLQVIFPVKPNRPQDYPTFLGEDCDSPSFLEGEMPIDIVYYFHKALKKDLERLVFGSFRLTEEPEILEDFREQFRLAQLLYQVHSNAEDEIAFPALEAQGKGRNISHSYTIDHKLEVEHFNCIYAILDKMSQNKVSSVHHELSIKLQDRCRSMQQVLTDHIHHEEIEIWSLFRKNFSVAEQEKIAGSMLGRTRAEILQDMIPWLMGSLSQGEHRAMMRLWKRVTRNTMFSEWLKEMWDPEDHNADKTDKPSQQNVLPSTSFQTPSDPLEIISKYLSGDILKEQERSTKTVWDNKTTTSQESLRTDNTEQSRQNNIDHEAKNSKKGEKGSDQLTGPELTHEETLSSTSQEELEAAIRRVSRDSSLDSQKKAYIIQNLLMSRWIIMHRKPESVSSEVKDIPGSSPSFRDPTKMIYGCKHYKKNCKLLADCCNEFFTCRRCHDEITDHTVDRKSITKMLCMKCLVIQPIGPTCATASCNNLSMGRYYCRICRIHDDEREIYHCPYCNLCRVGKGLGIDYFHCMNCNACMSRSLSAHVCREKCFEDYCPICHEYIFTSCSPIKGLPCGHLMHSTCFQDYTCSHYTCPICSKSLGDMQVYFQMLDTLLAEEKMPDEYLGQTQAILCNDCEKRGSASFHWLYHKCPHCGSYNTRLL